MQPNMKKIMKKWLQRLIMLLILCGIVWLNMNRFNHNIFANYEKAVDYGRVREYKEVINPVITAVFYAGKNEAKSDIASYMSHLDNYRTRNVKMLIVPEKITGESEKVITKLYKEIKKHNSVKYIVLVHRQNEALFEHLKLLKQMFETEEVEAVDMTQDVAVTEKNLEDFLREPEGLVVFAADLKQRIDLSDGDLLVNETLYFAQKNHYKIHVFDEVDTQLAQAWEDDYAAWFENAEGKDENILAQQQSNLKNYVEHYGEIIKDYFAANLHKSQQSGTTWPQKNEQNYRLFDRGYVYVRFFTTGGKEVFSRAKVGKNKGIIVGIIEIARKAVAKVSQPIESARIYLLTDLEKIGEIKNKPLIKYLETDDGVYIQYRKQIALIAADERPDDADDLMTLLRQRAQIPESVSVQEIEFYKFKTVEIDYEN